MTGFDHSHWLDREPYSMNAAEKSGALTEAMRDLTEWHRDHCAEYGRILDLVAEHTPVEALEDVPFIPVRLFKELDLMSIGKDQVFKMMTSSGTSGQQVSRIYLDKETAALQSKILARLMGEVLGRKRLPMLVIDSPSVLRNRNAFSARGAGILGFSLFGQDVTYALDDDMKLDIAAVEAFLERHSDQPIFLFGFTFMIWQHFYTPLKAMGKRLPIDKGILLHGGGWKKLQDQAVGNAEFRAAMAECAGIARVVNYYGMVEQTGSIFLECEEGHLHAPIYADVIIRDPSNFQALEAGKTGLIEVMSLIPRSYPGHALLTEDIGRIEGEDDCRCGRRGKYFTVAGRVAKAEVRGCSDTYEKHS
ncbi:acyl-protein synthetase [Rhizobium leguminosarum]|uniref:Phenylacetate-coenzyme A ligase PaaK-like adenylate-forming protein n=1 Tax=Rhizobium leguminosarum TaxID=384 RepID=A0A7X0DSU4_RHILE|nr:acyl-protein synthetase [Rhizobium leguminosarum]MBB5665858.1 phenylacetate-coenzyme A ligase PaaK-like adenylate-forming protein [Rhizobium leguminosarum]MBB6221756.1 phenylacetate-coenzyme A ligase PaaK-like adenylate-forming protein [Rhizobium leguminosarum]